MLFSILPFYIILGALLILFKSSDRSCLMLVSAGDEDMKIVPPGGFSPSKPAEDASEREAREYMRQKNAGNIELARSIGEKFAWELLSQNSNLFSVDPDAPDAELRRHQQIVLYSYAVNRVISEYSPGSILMHTSLNVFYDTIEQQSEELHSYVGDMAAFSLYILWERKGADRDIGKIYAGLCGAEDSEELVREGNELHNRYHSFCISMYQELEFHPVRQY